MNIHIGGGRSSGDGDLRLDKLIVFVIFFSSVSKVQAITVEWSLVSPYQLSQSKSNWQTLQGAGDTANVDFSKGGQIAFVPAAAAGYGGYGLYNRAYSPRQINLYMGHPKRGRESSSEEHRHKKKRHHRDFSEEKRDYEPEHHNNHEHHPQHHKSAKEELNDEHAEQAEISAGIAGELTKMSHFMKAQMAKHIEMRDRELNQGNEEAAKKEQIIIDMYQDQIKYLDGIEKAQEAIMAGEVEMYYDKDGAGHKPGHHGHHEGHGNHHGGNDHHRDADEPTHHHEYNEDDDEDEGHGYGHDDGDEDEEGHGGGHHGGEDDEEEEHGGGHHGGEDDDEEEHGGGHHEGQGDEDEFKDADNKFEDDDDTKHDPDYDPDDKHKLDKRSPFVSSFLPSLSGTDTTSLKTPDTTTVDATINSAPHSDTAVDVKADAAITTPDTSLSTPPTDVANPSAPPTPVVVSPNENTNSGWFSWFGSNNTPVYSPYALLDFMKPADKSSDNLMSMFNVFSDPSNSSYLSNASTLMRIVMFFMPGTGIVDQVYFTMALSKIMWEAATMYYEGYGNTEIAVVVLGELVEAAYLSRRDEDSIISQKILTPGNTVKIEGMDVPAFLKYVKNMKYPDLTEVQETKLQKDLDNLINITYPNISPELKTTFTSGLKDTLRFLALFNVQGDLHVDNVDVNFSEVYIRMHSAFDDSPIEKIKKTILSAIDAVKSNFS